METETEEEQMEKQAQEQEEAFKQEDIKEKLRVLAKRIRENSTIDWDAKNQNRPSGNPEEFGCEICNGEIEQPDAFSQTKENPGLCNNCSELVVSLNEK